MTPKDKPKKKSAEAEKTPAPKAPSRKPYLTFARKWRPQTFSEVVGQKNAVLSLRNALDQQRIANAYLFCGPRGTGKTSMARILAKSLNCAQGITSEPCDACDSCRAITAGVHLDVIEIDGASYTRTEQIQEFLEGINRNPFSARFKVYIIDEVHMLSAAAFNRLLKTLEEPPEFVVFILATTNAEKIPATIVSRCQVQEFNAIDAEDIKARLGWIADQEGIALDAESRDAILDTLAHHAEGGLRDASVALDQLINLCDGQLTLEAARQLLGLVDREMLFQTMELLLAGNTAGLMEIVDHLSRKGRNLERFASDLLGLVRDALLAKSRRDASLLQGHYTAERIQWFADHLAQWDYAFLLNLANQMLWAQEKMKTSANPRFLLEFAFIKLTAMQEALSVDRLADRLQKLAASPLPAAGSAPTAETATAAQPAPKASSGAGGQTALFNQNSGLDFKNGLGLRGAAPQPAMMSDVLRDGAAPAAAPAPMVRETAAPTANVNVADVWAKVRKVINEKHPFLDNHLDDVRPLGLQGKRLDLGILKSTHTEYNLGYLNAPSRLTVLRHTITAVLGFEVTVRFSEITAEQDAAASVLSGPQIKPPDTAGEPPFNGPDGGSPPASLHDSAPLNQQTAMPAQPPARQAAPPDDFAATDDDGAPESAEAMIYENLAAADEAENDVAPGREAAPPLGAPRTLNEAFARFPEFKSAVMKMQRLIDGEIVGFEPA